MKENIYICPDGGTPLEFAYEREDGTKVYYCPEGDEHYYFKVEDGYLYAVCTWNGAKPVWVLHSLARNLPIDILKFNP